MRVVIIGGRGMIGQALAKELNEHGHSVTILTRGETQRQPDGSVCLNWDGKDSQKLAALLKDQEGVVNLAGESIGKGRWTSQRKEQILRSRIEPGKALVSALKTAQPGPEVILQASAIGFYGTGEDVFDETTAAGTDWLAGVCLAWEGILEGLNQSKIRKVVIRSGVVLDRRGGVLSQLALPIKMFAGGPMGNGRQWISWIHIQDEVRAIRFLLERGDCQGAYNLTAPDPATNQKLGKTLARVLHRPYWLPLPAFVMRQLLGEMSTLVLDGQKVLPVRLMAAGFKFDYPSLEPAVKNLYR